MKWRIKREREKDKERVRRRGKQRQGGKEGGKKRVDGVNRHNSENSQVDF